MTLIKSALPFQNKMPTDNRLIEAIMQLGAEANAAGVLVEQGGLLPMEAGASIKIANGEVTVTDGPYAEARELVGGYAVYETPTKEEALEWCRRFAELHPRFWPEWEGEIEIRQMFVAPLPQPK